MSEGFNPALTLALAGPTPWAAANRGVVTDVPTGGRVERVFTLGIFLYVVLRAIPIWKPLQDGSVNPWIFLALDLGTAYPYAIGWPRLYYAIKAGRADRIAGWSMVLTGSLLLPYLYVFAVGENIASWVWVVLGLFLFAALVSASLRVRKMLEATNV